MTGCAVASKVKRVGISALMIASSSVLAPASPLKL
jgi:hypothetical protein